MSDFLKVIGWISIIAGVIVGVIVGIKDDPLYEVLRIDPSFRWAAAITWWISGILSGVVFIALGMIMEKQHKIHILVSEIYRKDAPTPDSKPSLGNSKLNLNKASNYKMKTID